MTYFGYFLFACAGAGVLVCVSFAVFPWTLYLGARELPGALWCVLAGRERRRALRLMLKRRHAADREVLAALPKDVPYAVFALRYAYAAAAVSWARLAAFLFGAPQDPGLSLRSRAVPARPGRETVGAEAAAARAEHDRYEREFAAKSPVRVIPVAYTGRGRCTALCLEVRGDRAGFVFLDLGEGPESCG